MDCEGNEQPAVRSVLRSPLFYRVPYLPLNLTIALIRNPGETSPYDYFGVTFDHLVPVDDPDPEVLQVNVIDVDKVGGNRADTLLLFDVDPAEYADKKVLAVPRCLQMRVGSTDRLRINSAIAPRNQDGKSL